MSSLIVAPGSVVVVRDEEWLVTSVDVTTDGQLLQVLGLSELVRGTSAGFYEVLDDIEPLDPSAAKLVPDDFSHHRRARLWLESMIRKIAMILSELVRRGRGERILIVCPRHVLEQMQHELWTRFALPFVRLDSAGVQRVKQKLSATRNPFTYFKRVIISMDTLKQRASSGICAITSGMP